MRSGQKLRLWDFLGPSRDQRNHRPGEGRGTPHRGVASAVRSLVVVATAGGIAVLAAVLLLRFITPQYTAVTVVGPTARTGAAAIGMRLPDPNRKMTASIAEPGAADELLSDFSRYLALLRSLSVARQIIGEPGVLTALFPERWDPVLGRWHPDAGGWATAKRGMLALVGRELPVVPDAVELANLLERRVTIAMVGTGPMRRVSFHHSDRDFALQFLQRLSWTAERQLREEAMRRAQVQIDLVKQSWDSMPADDHRIAMRALMVEEERLLMVLGADLPYAADVIEPVHAAALPDWPDALLVMAVSGLAGVVISAWLIGWRRFGWFTSAEPS